MKTPQEIATTILGKEPTLPEEVYTWGIAVDAIEVDRAEREPFRATRDDWTVEHHENDEHGIITMLHLWPAGADGLTKVPVATLSLTSAGVDALIATLKPGA